MHTLLHKTKRHAAASAFTLVETVIAMAVIGLVITASYSLTVQSLSLGRETTQRFTALLLAEEGLEVVRNVRDSNWLQNREWRRGLTDGTYAIQELPVETTGGFVDPRGRFALVPAEAETPPEAALGLRRAIMITTKDDMMHVQSRVLYGADTKIDLTEELTDWKQP